MLMPMRKFIGVRAADGELNCYRAVESLDDAWKFGKDTVAGRSEYLAVRTFNQPIDH